MSVPQVTPEQAVQDFLSDRENDVSKSSLRNYTYALEELVRFCAERDIEYVNDLNGYVLKQFKQYRRSDGIKEITLKNNLSTVRVFLRWCAHAELVEPGLAEMVQLPTLDKGDRTDDTKLELDHIEDIVNYLYKFEYGTMRHAMFQFIWHTCARMGTICALDVDDYHSRGQFIEVRHRPDEGSPLKNGHDAERQINLNDKMCDVLDDFIEVHRQPMTDEYDREPLFTAKRSARMNRTTLRKNIYALTRPCHISNSCPHDRDIETCEAANYQYASKCPSSISTHPLRRSAITYHLNQEWPKEKLSERANVSTDVLDEHYDARTESEKRNTRKQFLDNL